jgi:hypothetical protein
MPNPDTAERQEILDRFYWSRGTPCCAGCDHWRHHNALAGECLRSAPAPEAARWAMLGITGSSSLRGGAGHIATLRDHACGEFRDTFDWASLSPAYRRRVGATNNG